MKNPDFHLAGSTWIAILILGYWILSLIFGVKNKKAKRLPNYPTPPLPEPYSPSEDDEQILISEIPQSSETTQDSEAQDVYGEHEATSELTGTPSMKIYRSPSKPAVQSANYTHPHWLKEAVLASEVLGPCKAKRRGHT